MSEARRTRKAFRSERLAYLFDLVCEQEWRWRHTSGHVVVYPLDKTKPPRIMSLTAFDGPATKTTEGELKRSGLIVPPRGS